MEKTIKMYNHKRCERMLMRLPICCDWVKYKGETVVAQINYERTLMAKKPMVDISYCMTQAINQNIMYTVQWDKKKFTPSHLGYNWIVSPSLKQE